MTNQGPAQQYFRWSGSGNSAQFRAPEIQQSHPSVASVAQTTAQTALQEQRGAHREHAPKYHLGPIFGVVRKPGYRSSPYTESHRTLKCDVPTLFALVSGTIRLESDAQRI